MVPSGRVALTGGQTQKAADAERDPLAGTPYRARHRVGEGGMGEIYEAEEAASGKLVVVKLIHAALSGDPKLNERFRVEAEALALLHHPNVVDVTAFGRTPTGRPYFVMERLQGKTLGQVLRRRGPLPVPEALDLICQALSGIEAAHALGIIHRDIKLDNLFVCEDSEGTARRTVKVLDFGIVKLLRNVNIAPSAYPTEKGVIIGTPKYVSPEQVFGKPVDERSDLYAMGLVLFALLTGRGPFDHLQKEMKVMLAHAKLEPEPPSKYVREPLPAELDRAVLKALAKNPDERFQNAHAFRDELENISRILRENVAFQTTVFDRSTPARSAPRNSEAQGDTEVSPPDFGTEVMADQGDGSLEGHAPASSHELRQFAPATLDASVRTPTEVFNEPESDVGPTHTAYTRPQQEPPPSSLGPRQGVASVRNIVAVLVLTALVVAGLLVALFSVIS